MLLVSGEETLPIISRDANDPQKMGSAITYAKRYGLQAMFGIPADEDDDGNKANEAPKPSLQGAPSGGVSSPPPEVPLEARAGFCNDSGTASGSFQPGQTYRPNHHCNVQQEKRRNQWITK